MLGVAAAVCKAKKTLRNNSQQHATGYANEGNSLLDIQQFWELLVNDVASVCTELKQTRMSNFQQRNPARYAVDGKVIILLVRSVSLQITRQVCWERITQSTTRK